MTQMQPGQGGPVIETSQMALIVYILYLLGFVTGFTALAGVIVAHLKVGTADPVSQTHFRFQIYTFWIGVLYLIVGGILLFVLVGYLMLIWWFVWTLIRCIKGMMMLNERRAIDRPTSWLFG